MRAVEEEAAAGVERTLEVGRRGKRLHTHTETHTHMISMHCHPTSSPLSSVCGVK